MLQKFSVIVVRHKTDFHALLFVGRLEIAMPRDLAGVALGLFAERKHGAGKLLLPQRKQKITLILAQITSAFEQDASIVATFQTREMAGRNVLRAELIRAFDEPSELEILIAHHARIRRAPGFVFVGEILDDAILEFRGFVDEVIRNSKLMANRARIGDSLRSAAFVLSAIHAVLRPEFQCNSDDVITLLQ